MPYHSRTAGSSGLSAPRAASDPTACLWCVMQRCVTHNRFDPVFHRFAEGILAFPVKIPLRERTMIVDTVTDGFRVVTHHKHRLIGYRKYALISDIRVRPQEEVTTAR